MVTLYKGICYHNFCEQPLILTGFTLYQIRLQQCMYLFLEIIPTMCSCLYKQWHNFDRTFMEG